MATLTQVLADVLDIRGVLAAAVVSVDGEMLAGGAADTALLDRISGAVTGALAAGEALSGLMAKSLVDGVVADGGSRADVGAGADAAVAGELDATTAPAADAVASRGTGYGSKHLMVIYEDSGPIVFEPLPGGERIAVMALGSAHDLGRARFQLRGLTQALSTAEVPLG